MNRLAFLLGGFLLVLWGCDSTVAQGTNDETSTFVLSNGTPAANAAVIVYPAGSTDSLPLMKTWTDSRGAVALSAAARGYYSVVVRDTSGQATFIDSVYFDGQEARLPSSDTLLNTGRVRGRVAVQAQDDPRIAWVALLGAGVFSNLDDSGRFLLSNIPAGRFTLVARTDPSHASYTSTFRQAMVHPDSTTDLGTIDLVWTGLPLVTGIAGTWDSLGGTVSLRWDRSNSPKVVGYRVYRTIGSDPSQENPVGFVDSSRTGWRDSLFTGSKPVSAETLSVRYRVVAVDGSSAEGAPFHAWAGILRAPFDVARRNSIWTQVGPLPEGTIRLDTIAGGLVAVTKAPSGNLTLSISADGINWSPLKTVANDEDGLPTYDQGGGFADGLSWKGRWWWLRTMRSGRTGRPDCGSIGSPVPLADSLVVYSLGSGADLDSTVVAAASDSIASWKLLVDSAGLVLGEGSWSFNPLSCGAFRSAPDRFILKDPAASWSAAPGIAGWYFDAPSNLSSGIATPPNPVRYVSPTGQSRVLDGGGAGLFLDSLFFQGGSYSLAATPSQSHRLLGPTPSWIRSVVWWRGRIWVAAQSTLWTVTLP